MQSQTHALIGAVLFGREPRPAMAGAIVGALLPDAFMVPMIGWAIATDRTGELWDVMYWQEPWQTVGAIANSIPLFCLLAVVAWRWREHAVGRFVFAGAMAAVAHHLLDLPLHVDDAHSHFWPISSWRFISPVSYWDSAHHAAWVRPVEGLLNLGAAGLLYRRTKARGWRILLGLLAVWGLLNLVGGIALLVLGVEPFEPS